LSEPPVAEPPALFGLTDPADLTELPGLATAVTSPVSELGTPSVATLPDSDGVVLAAVVAPPVPDVVEPAA
jgi:hypothetical protein